MDRNWYGCSLAVGKLYVALLAEGVDRNYYPVFANLGEQVALLAEGVDRNLSLHPRPGVVLTSPSSRRAWIEIFLRMACSPRFAVALLAEGVDRNNNIRKILAMLDKVALLAEGVDRNLE